MYTCFVFANGVGGSSGGFDSMSMVFPCYGIAVSDGVTTRRQYDCAMTSSA